VRGRAGHRLHRAWRGGEHADPILENSLSTIKPVTCGTNAESYPHFPSAWAGLGVLSLYAVIALAAGGWLLARRDA
jgi:ABC-2 type transport system permease protein